MEAKPVVSINESATPSWVDAIALTDPDLLQLATAMPPTAPSPIMQREVLGLTHTLTSPIATTPSRSCGLTNTAGSVIILRQCCTPAGSTNYSRPHRKQSQRTAVNAANASSFSDEVQLPVDTLDPFSSKLAPPRRVHIMLPPSYHTSPATKRFPVLYMHDGQNAVNPATSFLGVDWGLDEALLAGIKAGKLQEFIAVLVWNTPQRLQEYMPADALRWLTTQEQCWYDRVEDRYYNPTSDAYLAMLAHELKPWIDQHYRTLPDRQSTAVMGSSMGGLVSLYGLQCYPEVFGAAACLSTHWVPGGGLPVAWLAQGNIPDPGTHRLYFDHGSQGLDGEYGPYQKQVDQLCRAAGYVEGVNFQSLVFPGEAHDELAWRKRLHLPLEFLFGDARYA